MKLSKKTRWTILIAATACILVVCSFLYLAFNMLRERFRHDTIEGIGIGLTLYAQDYKTLPPLDQWCDKLIEEADFGPNHFLSAIHCPDGMIGYALNENLEGLKFSELPDKTVLAFEAIGPWNQSGGPDLAKQWDYKNIAVLFVDGHMKFIRIEDIDTLRWSHKVIARNSC